MRQRGSALQLNRGCDIKKNVKYRGKKRIVIKHKNIPVRETGLNRNL